MALRPRTTNISTSAKWLAGVLVCVLAIGTILLVVLAIERTRPIDPGDQPEPVPSFTFGGPTATTTPTAAPSPSAAPATAPTQAGASQRFLSIGSGTMWRGTAGACDAEAPTIERSDDGGATWQDVTPTYRDIGRLLSLDAFAGTEAEIVASMGDGCETQALRTFTQGEFWEPYDDVLAASRYIDPTAPAAIVTPQGAIAAPCPSPGNLRAAGPAVALVCDGTAYELADGAWSPIETPSVLTLAIASGEIVLASTADDCAGVTVTRVADGEQARSCVADADAFAPLAIAGTADEVRLWSGDLLLTAP